VKRHQVLFLISFILVAVAIALLVVLTIQVRRLSYEPVPVRITRTVCVDGIPR